MSGVRLLHADVVHRNLARRMVRNPLALCYVYMKPTIETKETSFWIFVTLINHLLWKQRSHRKETIYSGLLDQQNSSHWYGAAPGPFLSSFDHKTSTRHWHQRCNDGWRLSCDHHTMGHNWWPVGRHSKQERGNSTSYILDHTSARWCMPSK